jgi:hypothetical protein
MTNFALCHTPKIRVKCPFEGRSIWDAYWSRPGTFKLIELARHVETFRHIILRSKEYQEFCSALALLKQQQVQQPNN